MEHWGFFWEYGGEREDYKNVLMNGTQDGHAKIYTDWQQLEGASWMASFHAEFFIYFYFHYIFDQVRFIVCVSGFEGTKGRKKTKKKPHQNGGAKRIAS